VERTYVYLSGQRQWESYAVYYNIKRAKKQIYNLKKDMSGREYRIFKVITTTEEI
jgi:hypothetical protein